MAGCFGNHPFDRAMEAQLMNHLNQYEEFYCEYCKHTCYVDECDYHEESNSLICPGCGKRHKLDLER